MNGCDFCLKSFKCFSNKLYCEDFLINHLKVFSEKKEKKCIQCGKVITIPSPICMICHYENVWKGHFMREEGFK